MKITREFIEAHRTKKGGFTFAQARALGAGWPPEKGWLKRAADIEHTPEAIEMFVKYAERAKTKIARREQRAERYIELHMANIPVAKAPPKKFKKQRAPIPRTDPTTHAFLQSYEWRALRMKALTKYGSKCMCCGATPEAGVVMHVDHIKPRRKFPMLALDLENLQILCEVCNHGKGNWDQTDWRPRDEGEIEPEVRALLRDMMKG